MIVVDVVSHGMEPQCRSQVVRFGSTIDDALHRVDLGLKEILEHAQLHNVTSADIWDGELSFLLDSLSLFRVDMIEQCLSTVHGRSWNLGRPIELRIVPLRKSFLFLVFWVVALMWDMEFIVTELLKDIALATHVLDFLWLLRLQVFLKPVLELLLRAAIEAS